MTTSARRRFLGTGVRALTGAVLASPLTDPSRGAPTALATAGGGTASVDAAAIARLRQRVSGSVLAPDAPGYDAARAIWNAAVDRRPALIVRCATERDVVEAVRFADRHDALVAVRGGGHHAAGFSVCDGGLLIDLSELRTVAVDAARRVAWVGGGATFADLDAATQAHGLATTGAIISMVGVGGYTLGGGMGWLHRTLGLACDNLIAARVVTADGRVVEASAGRHEDLFWALRGGGGSFGVAAALAFRLAPIASVLAGLIVHPLERLPEIAAFVSAFNAAAPDDLGVWVMMRRAPASAALPPPLHGRPVAMIGVCHAGPLDRAERAVQPLRAFGQPLADLVRVRPYGEWQRSLDAAWGPGFGNQWLGHYLPGLTDAAATTLLAHLSRVSSPFTDVKLVHLGGAVGRVGVHETAFGHRIAPYALAIQTRWAADEPAAPHLAWSRDLFEAMHAHATGQAYVNFMADEGEARVADAYTPDALRRLRAIKAVYDPGNRFRLNQNIRPSRSAV